MSKRILPKKDERFNHLVTTGEYEIRIIGRDRRPLTYVGCKCDCGKIFFAEYGHIIRSKIKSCGCYRKELNRRKLFKHGMKESKIYKIWSGMKKRVFNKNDSHYYRYGGRGIGICDEWLDFMNFYRDMNESYKTGLSIERIDNDGDYCPENCKWIPLADQGINTSRTHKIMMDGKITSMRRFCIKHKLVYTTTMANIRRGKLTIAWLEKKYEGEDNDTE